MDPIERIERATEVAGKVVNNIGEGDLDKQTPCSDFKVRDLLNHVLGGLVMLEDAAGGGSPAMPEGEQFTSTPGKVYDERRAKLLETVRQPGVLDKTWQMPFGALPGQMMAGIAFMEHLTHAWDLAKATGQDTTLPDDLVAECMEVVKPMDAMLRMPGVCTAAVEVPDNASPTDKLVAFLGRQP